MLQLFNSQKGLKMRFIKVLAKVDYMFTKIAKKLF